MTDPRARHARQLLERARTGFSPRGDDRARVEQALNARLDAIDSLPPQGLERASGRTGGGSPGGDAVVWFRGGLVKIGAGATVAALAAAASVFWPQADPAPPNAPADGPGAVTATAPSPSSTRSTRSTRSTGPEVPPPHQRTQDLAVVRARRAELETQSEAGPAQATAPATKLQSAPSGEKSQPGALVAAPATKARNAPPGKKSEESERDTHTADRAERRPRAAREGETARDEQAKHADVAGPETAAPREAPAPARSPSDHLADELELIRKASRALRQARPAEALAHLREHRASYQNGRLAAERSALTAVALCDLGRADAARAQAQAFLHVHGDSPLATRVQRAARCQELQ